MRAIGKRSRAGFGRLIDSLRIGSKGVLGDVGVHIVDFATFPVGPIAKVSCQLKTFPKAPKNRLGEYRLDANDSAVMNVEFKNGAVGVIHTTRWATGHPNQLSLRPGEDSGAIEINWMVPTTGYRLCLGDNVNSAGREIVTVDPTLTNYERFITAIVTGKVEQPNFARAGSPRVRTPACFRIAKESRY